MTGKKTGLVGWVRPEFKKPQPEFHMQLWSQWPHGLIHIGLRLLEHWDRGFESRSRHECMSAFFCVVLSCVGSGLATGWCPAVFTIAFRRALGPTQSPIQRVPGDLSLGIKRPRREADHSPPSSAEVKEWVEPYLHSPIRLHGVVLS
jgi:hypothetical protein